MAIGLHLLEIMNEEELKAIIIHELSHIYNKDTKMGSKLNNSIIRWSKIIDHTDRRNNFIDLLLVPFAKSYIEDMQMHILAVSKIQEFIADQEAADYTSNEIYAKALVKLELRNYSYAFDIKEEVSRRTGKA